MHRVAPRPRVPAGHWRLAPAADRTTHTSAQSAIYKERDSPSTIAAVPHDGRTARADDRASSHRRLVRCSALPDQQLICVRSSAPAETTHTNRAPPATIAATRTEKPSGGF